MISAAPTSDRFAGQMLYLPAIVAGAIALFYTATGLQDRNLPFLGVCAGLWLIAIAAWAWARVANRSLPFAARYLIKKLRSG